MHCLPCLARGCAVLAARVGTDLLARMASKRRGGRRSAECGVKEARAVEARAARCHLVSPGCCALARGVGAVSPPAHLAARRVMGRLDG